MKNLAPIFIALLIGYISTAQVGINTTEPITSLDEIEVMAASGNILDGSTLDVYKVTVA